MTPKKVAIFTILMAVLAGIFLLCPNVARSVGLVVERNCGWDIDVTDSFVDFLGLLREGEAFVPGVTIFVLTLVGLCLSFLFLGFVSGLHSLFRRAREVVLSDFRGWYRFYRRNRR